MTTSTWRDYVADHLPDPDGQPLFNNPTAITTAALLYDLANSHGMTIPRSALPQRWAQQFLDRNHTSPLPDHTISTPTTRQIKTSLTALNNLGAIHHDRRHITDHLMSARSQALTRCDRIRANKCRSHRLSSRQTQPPIRSTPQLSDAKERIRYSSPPQEHPII